MIRRYGYFVLAFALLIVLSASDSLANTMRSAAVGTASPSWRHLSNFKDIFIKITTIWPSGGYHTPPQIAKELEMLRLENHQLHSQVKLLKAELKLDLLVKEQENLLMQNKESDPYAKRRKEELFRQLELYAHAITARVIFRENTAWKSCIWVNVGEETNQRLQTRLIEKNSPVVLGKTVVGLVDYVGEKRSKIRLLTDRAVTPSVRIVRLREEQRRNVYLAKGQTRGASSPLWRSYGITLQGVGFNYDFEDVEGLRRPLSEPLIQEGDLVMTTGMDGLFPAALHIGKVSKVYPLKEGSSSYEADICSFVETFDDLEFVTILPALSDQN
jgi:cell shape-determining protein MreC